MDTDDGERAAANGVPGRIAAPTPTEILLASAKAGDAQSVAALLVSGLSPDSTDSSELTPLIWAAWGGHVDTAKVLVDYNTDVNRRDNRGKTALMAAAWQGNAEMTTLLLDHGADANAKDREGDTALLKAMGSRSTETALALLEHGAAIEEPNARGYTPLMLAAANGPLKTVEMLIARGALDHYQTEGREFNAQTLAAWGGHPDIVEFLSALHPTSPEVGSLVYERGVSGRFVVTGTTTFKGALPPPKVFDLSQFPNTDYCLRADSDGKGRRLVQEVIVNNSKLQDVVVYIRGVTSGKPFLFRGTDVKASGCRFLVQGGPSTLVGVVANGSDLRVLNDDANPRDPRTESGVLHNPHPFEVWGASNSEFGGRHGALPEKGQTWSKRVTLKRKESTLKLECDQHNYEQVFFLRIENPYYAIVGPDGMFTIDQVPAGKYEMIAWHPVLGVQKKGIEVGSAGTVTAAFEFSWTNP